MKGSLSIFDELTQSGLESGAFRGSVIRIEHQREPVFERSWGHALWTSAENIPMDLAQLFDLASLSKLFTTTAVLRLMSTGFVREDSRLIDLLEFKDSKLRDPLSGITLSALLDHSSGLHYWYPFYTRSSESFESILSFIVKEHPLTEGMVYSDLNFMLLGLTMERITGKPLREAMRDIVFRPLGLKTATYAPEPLRCAATEFGNRIERRMVAGLGLSFDAWRDETVPIRGACDDGNAYYYFKGVAAHAGIFADAADVARLGALYLDGCDNRGGLFLDPSVRFSATTDRGSGRGLGFQFGDLYPGGGFGHTGFSGTYLHINPVSGLTITILTNRLHVAGPVNINEYRRAVSEAAVSLYTE
ncbi:MAG: serine hydrolase domain-containing protein [Spirochaetota bacterium]